MGVVAVRSPIFNTGKDIENYTSDLYEKGERTCRGNLREGSEREPWVNVKTLGIYGKYLI
jgi:hypothetical protein